MGCCDQPGLMPLNDGIEKILALVNGATATESVELSDAAGRVLASPILAQSPSPSFDNSAMDGFAVKLSDTPLETELTIQGTAFAGKPYLQPLTAGNAIRIMTGAALPQGADTVIMQEMAHYNENCVRFNELVKAGSNVRKTGDDFNAGDRLVAANTLLNAAHIALLASAGCKTVEVYKRTRVALISTGDELKQPGEALNYGELYDSNRPAIRQMLVYLNVEIVDYGSLPDQPELFREAFLKADSECDFVITSGGVSVGEADFTKDILAELGEIDFWKLAIKPGKPFAFGKLPNSFFIGLPGNPVSAMVTFHILASQAIRQHQRIGYKPMKVLKAIIDSRLKKSPGRQDFQRGVWSTSEQGLTVSPAGAFQGSHILTGLAEANCYIALENERGSVEPGEQVDIWLFDEVL
ncbi:gephyrin-like molybdotransferase Glp [Reinekea marinisedimentorum]|uniref:Molybdopterin molybdenumtransferase n=1 Tax=Reinekea marinisedimentorum TaxID=230495 RepID=A0A4R3I2W8_9GAMM|nr:gephyrin-like molybdotransferase Glp [Reinekea marinisedimentorum]TCS40129.1 molybdopterin molybdotransferase [Reinekea marinisedimentorum]